MRRTQFNVTFRTNKTSRYHDVGRRCAPHDLINNSVFILPLCRSVWRGDVMLMLIPIVAT